GRYYYWHTESDAVCWLSPRHPKAVLSESAAHIREEMKLNEVDDDEEDEDDDEEGKYSDMDDDGEKTLVALQGAKASSQQDDLLQYAQQRKAYKTLIKATKSKPPTTSCIPMETWENHFNNILNSQNVTIPCILVPTKTTENASPITKDEIKKTIKTARNGKASGPDSIYTEHLMDSMHVLQETFQQMPEVTLQTKLTSFNFHATEKATAAVEAIYNIQEPQKILLATAITLFKTAIAPIATYGINIIWDKLTNNRESQKPTT
ncbi:hypothetical protein C0J52_25505, partial [Blattella germanica]